MPQFSLKRLFVSVTLITAGCGMFVGGTRRISWNGARTTLEGLFVLTLLAGGVILAIVGVGTLFKRPVVSGGIAVLLLVALWLVVRGI